MIVKTSFRKDCPYCKGEGGTTLETTPDIEAEIKKFRKMCELFKGAGTDPITLKFPTCNLSFKSTYNIENFQLTIKEENLVEISEQDPYSTSIIEMFFINGDISGESTDRILFDYLLEYSDILDKINPEVKIIRKNLKSLIKSFDKLINQGVPEKYLIRIFEESAYDS